MLTSGLRARCFATSVLSGRLGRIERNYSRAAAPCITMATSVKPVAAAPGELSDAQEMVKFINYAWTPYHAVGTPRVLCYTGLVPRDASGPSVLC